MGCGSRVPPLDNLHFRLNWQARMRNVVSLSLKFRNMLYDEETLNAVEQILRLPRSTRNKEMVNASLYLQNMEPRILPGDVDTKEDLDILPRELCDNGLSIGWVGIIKYVHRDAFNLWQRCLNAYEDRALSLLDKNWYEEFVQQKNKKKPTADFCEWINKTLQKIPDKNVGQRKLADVAILWAMYNYNHYHTIDMATFIAHLRYLKFKFIVQGGDRGEREQKNPSLFLENVRISKN